MRRCWCKSPYSLILHATNTEQVTLIVVAAAHILEVVVHVPVVGFVAIAIRGTPPKAPVADTAEIAIGTAVAARQGGKAIFVLAIAIIVPTARCFQIPTCN